MGGGDGSCGEALGETAGAKEEAVALISLSCSGLQRFPFMCKEINIDRLLFFDKWPEKSELRTNVESFKKPHGK